MKFYLKIVRIYVRKIVENVELPWPLVISIWNDESKLYSIQNVNPKIPLVISTWNVEFELHLMISI